MDRAYESGAAGSAPAAPASPSTGYPSAGNPGAGTPATKPGPFWYHAVTEEIRAVIAAAGITPDAAVVTQLSSAIQKIVQTSAPLVATAGGTANAVTAIYTPAITALTNGMTVFVRPTAANTGAVTFTPAPGVLAAVAVVKGANAALVAGDVAGAGHWLEMQYDTALTKWVLLNPAKGVNVSTTDATKQPLDATLTALAALVASADKMIYSTGADAFALTAFTALARNLLAGADESSMRTTLGVLGCTYSLGTTGYIVFPAWFLGGLVVQWGTRDIPSGNFAVTLPQAFPTACRNVVSTQFDAAGTTATGFYIRSVTNTTLNFYSNGAKTGLYWLAIGD